MSIAVYWNLPLELLRKDDINFGNRLIENIKIYQRKYNKLPENNDWKTLEKLGFDMELLGTNPSYQTNKKGEFELVFLEGFDGPYLVWNSNIKRWKIDFPSLHNKSIKQVNNTDSKKSITKVNGKAILFLRPSDLKFETLKNEKGIYELDSDFGFAIQRTIDFLKANQNYESIKKDVVTERFIEITDCLGCPKIIDRDSIFYGLILTRPNNEIKLIKNLQTLHFEHEIEAYFNK